MWFAETQNRGDWKLRCRPNKTIQPIAHCYPAKKKIGGRVRIGCGAKRQVGQLGGQKYMPSRVGSTVAKCCSHLQSPTKHTVRRSIADFQSCLQPPTQGLAARGSTRTARPSHPLPSIVTPSPNIVNQALQKPSPTQSHSQPFRPAPGWIAATHCAA